MSKDILIIPDAHAHPDYDNNRFTWLGRFIVDKQPDIILQGGDLADCPSLSSYDKGTRGFEGRRYKRDIAATVDAQEKLFRPIKEYNRKKAQGHRKRYKPRKIILMGNHEDRADRVSQLNPELEGTVSSDDFKYKKYWDEVYDFKEIVNVCGFTFSHFMPSGLMGRPIGGEHVAASLLKKLFVSSVTFHNHVFDVAERTTADGNKIVGISAGCFTHPDYVEGWCRNTRDMWWRGVIYIKGAREGYYDELQAITMRRLEELYA